jgi:Zn-dependent metalloprotease
MSLTPKLLSLAVLVAICPAAAAVNPGRVSTASNSPTVVRALTLLQLHGAAARVAINDRFTAQDVIVDANGTEHVRFDRSYAGLRVVGGDFVVHSRNGRMQSISSALRSSLRPDLRATLSSTDAIVEAGAAFGSGFRGVPTVSKVIYARDVTPTLAYEVVMTGTKADHVPTEMHYFIDAKNGRLLDQWDTVCTVAAAGTGRSLMAGNVALTTNSLVGGGFQMVDPTRGGNTTYDYNTGSIFTDADNVWGNYTNTDSASPGSDIHYGIANVWDYYKNTFKRLGIFNNGKGVISRLFPRGYGLVNAYWTGSEMYYGDGDGATYLPLVSLDITGHEMTHGVNQATAGLVYSGDAGGLNEANSDILGTMTEYYANNASDPGDFLIGEKIFSSNPGGTKALRYMFKQDLDGYSYSCYRPNGFDRRRFIANDPHSTSGVANRFIYLLAQGAVVPAGFGAGTRFNLTKASLVCNGNTALVGIGRIKAAAIWYKALTTYFTSTTSYPGARAATLHAASDLYGGVASPEYKAVAAAWSASNVN